MSTQNLVAERPVPGQPRAYDFPATVRTQLANGLRVVVTPMPGRARHAAQLRPTPIAVHDDRDMDGRGAQRRWGGKSFHRVRRA